MTHRGTILILDDEPQYRETLSELLQGEGFQILDAGTLKEAEQILANNWIHMAIVDLSMTGEAKNRDGMNIVNNPAYSAIPKVILTGHGYDPTLIRDTLKNDLVVDFIDKHERDAEQRLIKVFAEEVHLNWDLEIVWNSPQLKSLVTFASFVVPLQEKNYLSHRIDELENLLRLLFSEYCRITIGRLLTYNAEVVWVEVFAQETNQTNRQGNRYIVSCGRKGPLQNQIQQYQECVWQGNSTGSTKIVNVVETLRYAAVSYDCVGGDSIAGLLPLKDLYSRCSTNEVVVIMDSLFKATLASWHSENSTMQDVIDLRELYALWTNKPFQNARLDDMQAKLKQLCNDIAQINSLLQINFSNENLGLNVSDAIDEEHPNPFHFLFEENIALDSSIKHGTIHGSVHLGNILTNDLGNAAWLIDFSTLDQGPLVFDYITVETSLKAELMTILDIKSWITIEKHLLSIDLFDESSILLTDHSPEVQKILKLIMTTHQYALETVNRDFRLYFASRFVYSVTQLEKYNEMSNRCRSTLLPYIYHLISASLLCHELTSSKQFEPNFEAKSILVEGKKISGLTKMEWKILEYMHKNVGQLCTFKQILKDVYEDAADDVENPAWVESSKDKVTAAIRRLRGKIEPEPKTPRYILTEREHGYKLVI